jgi:hypothetical protein
MFAFKVVIGQNSFDIIDSGQPQLALKMAIQRLVLTFSGYFRKQPVNRFCYMPQDVNSHVLIQPWESTKFT